MSAYALVTLRLASGEVVGPLNLFGSGGVVMRSSDVQRFRDYVDMLILRANGGRPLPCYEPAPGHCLMLRVGVTDEGRRAVDLRGAVIIDVN